METKETCTDTFNFNNLTLFKDIKNCLPEDKTKTQNIIECKDDMLYVWNSKDCSIYALNWRLYNVKNSPASTDFQVLLPAPQNFLIDKLVASNEGFYLALSGSHGVCVVELPRRCGPNGMFLDGKKTIICRSYNLDERFFVHNNNVELLQIRWHAASPTDSHLLMLLSDNSIRVYDESVLKHVWRIGPMPYASPATGSSYPFLNSLGDTAVDFDIIPPRNVPATENSMMKSMSEIDTRNQSKADGSNLLVEWPIVILRGNGSIYMLCGGLDSEKPHLQGPLTILPTAEDNFGVDYCAISAIQTTPTTLILAECNGHIHHGLLLENEKAEESFNEVDNSIRIYPSEWMVHILETVELELGLPDSDKTKGHSCPIHIKRDLVNESRYFAYHNTGLHIVVINFVRELQEYFMKQDESDKDSSLFFNKQSHAEYVVCTKALSGNNVNTIFGFSTIQSPSGLVLLLSTGQVVSLDLITDPTLLDYVPEKTIDMKSESNDNKKLPDSFENHIRNILRSGVSQPILKLGNTNEPNSQECLELLMQAALVLRENYFTKHEKARQEIQKRINILRVLKEQQEQEVSNLQQEIETIRNNAEHLAETYEDLCDKQQVLFKKAQEIVRNASLHFPRKSMAEKEFATQVEKIHAVTKMLKTNIEQTKKKLQDQEFRINQLSTTADSKKLVLRPNQKTAIMDVISNIALDIESQVKEIKQINKALNMG